MKQKEKSGRYKTCSRKRMFRTRAEARGTIIAMGDFSLRAYSCPYCHGYHIGHKT